MNNRNSQTSLASKEELIFDVHEGERSANRSPQNSKVRSPFLERFGQRISRYTQQKGGAERPTKIVYYDVASGLPTYLR